ncbi:glycosyltransferase family 2 protein [Otoolea muris]|uniref:glycosyltransferase family 2 protein n=1 Tax=Otoolea muris TaxID=2941515 RepID=UPI00203BE11B|nr:glycosyltransferase [Otoolea muris]
MNETSYQMVSVVVISYRSAKTIEETLESVYRQTYPNIELIVSDDCSDDDTVFIAKQWIDKHQGRFSRTQMIESGHNTGTAGNMNRGVHACHGLWVKTVAADDILLTDCISDYMDKVNEDKLIKFYQSDERFIDENGKLMDSPHKEKRRMKKMQRFNLAAKQYQYLLLEDIKLSPTLFFEKNAFLKIGGCDETIRNLEDYPLKLRFLKHGYRMGYLEKETVQYRIHNSVSRDVGHIYNLAHIEQKRQVKKLYCNPFVPKYNLVYWVSELVEFIQIQIAVRIFKNKSTVWSQACMGVMRILKPKNWMYM